jgi:hypothetical protein
MEDNSRLKLQIDGKIEELYITNNFFALPLIVEGGYNQYDAVSKKLKSVRRMYNWLYLPLACILVVLVFIACFAQIFEFQFLHWDKAGLIVLFSLTSLMNLWRYKFLIERLKMMLFLIELKKEI